MVAKVNDCFLGSSLVHILRQVDLRGEKHEGDRTFGNLDDTCFQQKRKTDGTSKEESS